MRALTIWIPTISGYVNSIVHSVRKPNCAPAYAYVAIPDGSSSAAPVMSPGPSCFSQSRNLRRIEIPLDRGGL